MEEVRRAAAAVYCARKGFNTAVIAKSVGGQVRETMDIENLISVPKTTGPQLAADLKTHLSQYAIDIFEDRNVDSADVTGSEKTLVCGNETFKGKALIIATGAGWRKLSIPGESEHIGHGVAFCTHCDGPFYAGKRVAVIGGGNSGIEAAIDLAAMCPHVDVFEFLDTLKADGVLQSKSADINNIDIHVSSQVTEIIGDGKNVSGIKVKDRVSGAETVYPVSGVFVQIGLVPNSLCLKTVLQLPDPAKSSWMSGAGLLSMASMPQEMLQPCHTNRLLSPWAKAPKPRYLYSKTPCAVCLDNVIHRKKILMQMFFPFASVSFYIL